MLKPPVEKPPTRHLLETFDKLHRARLGVPAVIHGGKDAKLIAGIWKSHGDELVLGLMADFFASDDRFIRQNGYSIGMFVSQCPKLIARRPRRPVTDWRDECQRLHGGRCTNRTFHEAQL